MDDTDICMSVDTVCCCRVIREQKRDRSGGDFALKRYVWFVMNFSWFCAVAFVHFFQLPLSCALLTFSVLHRSLFADDFALSFEFRINTVHV